MQFWGDIILHHPDLIPELPGGVVALEWGYGADHPFLENGGKFADAGVPFYVCPGTSSWNSIAGRTDNAIANIRSAAESGLARGAIGLLNTDWGDNGHWQHSPVSYLGLAYGAAVSWCTEANSDIDLPRALDVHAFHDDGGTMGGVARDLGNAYQQPAVIPPNSSILHHILLRSPRSEAPISTLTEEGLEKTETYVDSVIARMSKARMKRPDAKLIEDEFRNTADLLRHACHVGMARLRDPGQRIAPVPEQRLWAHRRPLPEHVVMEIARMPREKRSSLAAELASIMDSYRRLWLARNGPGGLEDSVGRWRSMLEEYRRRSR